MPNTFLNVQHLNPEMSTVKNAKYPIPKTPEDAEFLLNKAINQCDFEAAEQIEQDRSDLVNFENEMNLGQMVSSYFKKHKELSNRLEQKCEKTINEINLSLERTESYYKKEFSNLREIQETEMAQAFAQWRASREAVTIEADDELDTALNTAKLLAAQKKFKEAIAMREAAKQLHHDKLVQEDASIDKRFEKRIRMITERHRLELQRLISSRNEEIRKIKKMKKEAIQDANDDFHILHAQAVVDVAEGFDPQVSIPLSLRMQVNTGKPLVDYSKTFDQEDVGITFDDQIDITFDDQPTMLSFESPIRSS